MLRSIVLSLIIVSLLLLLLLLLLLILLLEIALTTFPSSIVYVNKSGTSSSVAVTVKIVLPVLMSCNQEKVISVVCLSASFSVCLSVALLIAVLRSGVIQDEIYPQLTATLLDRLTLH